LQYLFVSNAEIKESLNKQENHDSSDTTELSPEMRNLMDDLGLSLSALKSSSIFSGDEERFAFARALSRLAEMRSKQWVDRGLGVGMSGEDSKSDRDAWKKARSRWREDSM
jgi:peroxisome-assembly ATPase